MRREGGNGRRESYIRRQGEGDEREEKMSRKEGSKEVGREEVGRGRNEEA